MPQPIRARVGGHRQGAKVSKALQGLSGVVGSTRICPDQYYGRPDLVAELPCEPRQEIMEARMALPDAFNPTIRYPYERGDIAAYNAADIEVWKNQDGGPIGHTGSGRLSMFLGIGQP